MTNTHTPSICPATRQNGAALIIGLVLLISLTIVGISVLSTTSLEQRMAGNMTELNMAFNNAETGGQAVVAAIATLPGDIHVLCQRLNQPVTCADDNKPKNWWDTADSNWWANNAIDLGSNLLTGDRVVTGSGSGFQRQPQVSITAIPPHILGQGFVNDKGNGQIIRITVRGTGTSDNTEVILQQDVIFEN
jgi:type IV pilus assembly protein PilX